jgi:hypothetical protein
MVFTFEALIGRRSNVVARYFIVKDRWASRAGLGIAYHRLCEPQPPSPVAHHAIVASVSESMTEVQLQRQAGCGQLFMKL